MLLDQEALTKQPLPEGEQGWECALHPRFLLQTANTRQSLLILRQHLLVNLSPDRLDQLS